jgi:hypothetical protein
MAIMTRQRRGKNQKDWSSDWWLLPSALILAMTGWGQAMWMWENTHPEGATPLWLLLCIGVGVAGLALPVYWLTRRWWPSAWLAAGVWVAVPMFSDMARQYNRTALAQDTWLHRFSPLLTLFLLGVGFSGFMIGLTGYAARRLPELPPSIRPLREGFWSGIFVVACGWLLIYRAFTLAAMILLAGSLVLLEIYLVLRESPRKRRTRRKR